MSHSQSGSDPNPALPPEVEGSPSPSNGTGTGMVGPPAATGNGAVEEPADDDQAVAARTASCECCPLRCPPAPPPRPAPCMDGCSTSASEAFLRMSPRLCGKVSTHTVTPHTALTTRPVVWQHARRGCFGAASGLRLMRESLPTSVVLEIGDRHRWFRCTLCGDSVFRKEPRKAPKPCIIRAVTVPLMGLWAGHNPRV